MQRFHRQIMRINTSSCRKEYQITTSDIELMMHPFQIDDTDGRLRAVEEFLFGNQSLSKSEFDSITKKLSSLKLYKHSYLSCCMIAIDRSVGRCFA